MTACIASKSLFCALAFFPFFAASRASGELLIGLNHASQNIRLIDTNHLSTSTLIGNISTGTDLYELRRAGPGLLYTFDRDGNDIITISEADAHTVNVVHLDQDVFTTRRGFDFSPQGVLYGVLPGMQLRTINPATGVTTFIANITGASRVEAIAFAPDGRLFAAGSADDDANSENLYRLNPASGVLTLLGNTGVVDTDTLEFGFDGNLYGANSVDGTNAELYRYNLATGFATDLGNSAVPGLNGLVAVPEPASLAVFSIGCLLLARRTRRR